MDIHRINITLLSTILVALAIFLIFYLFWRLVRKTLVTALTQTTLDRTITHFIELGLRYSILLTGAVTALEYAGISMHPLIAGLGIVGLTLGFASKEILENVFSGLMVLWDRPFGIGDLVEINGRCGSVEEINLRSTRIVTLDGRILVIPNRVILNSAVTMQPHVRVDVEFPLDLNENVSKIREAFLKCMIDDDRFLKIPEPKVLLAGFRDDHMIVQLQIWLKDPKEHLQIAAALVRERMLVAAREVSAKARLQNTSQTLQHSIDLRI